LHRSQRSVKILLLLVLFVRVLFTFHRSLNADEFQHLHNAWMIHLGFLPYRDFWDNHTPLLAVWIAPLLGFIGPGVSSVLIMRVLLSFCALLVLIPVYKIARAWIDEETAWMAVLVLGLSEIFMQKTIEVRPDFALSFFFLMSLWICIRNPAHNLAGGLMLGVAALFSPKALIALIAAGLLLPFAQQPVPFPKRIKRAMIYGIGFAIPIAGLAAYFYSKNALSDFVRCTLLENLSYPDTRNPFFLLFPQNLTLLLLSLIGVGLWFHKNRWPQPLSVLFSIGILLFLLLAFVMPAPFSQSALMFLPIFAIGAAYAIQQSTGVLKVLAVIAGILVPIVTVVIENPLKNSNTSQFELMKYVLRNSPRNASIFDGNAAYIFRKQSYYYGSLVEGVRQRIQKGSIRASIPKSLAYNGCAMIIDDERVADLPDDFQSFFRNNYVPAELQNVYVAGKNLSAESISGNHATFTIELPMKYKVISNTSAFHVDGKIYNGPVFLAKGNHRIDANTGLTYVKIRGL
jgi:dolichyl-phosphate-mannose-protein mannosyltransferase